MFELFQDYMNKYIDEDELVVKLPLCQEYNEASPEIKKKLDVFIDMIDVAASYEAVVDIITSDYLYNLGIEPDIFKVLELATRIRGGIVPELNPEELAAFIDLSIEHNDDERVMRLACNYNYLLVDKTKIEDYFIGKRDIRYIIELGCNMLIGIHYDRIIDALVRYGKVEELKFFCENISDKRINLQKVIERIKELSN